MEIIKGKVAVKAEASVPEPPREVELFTAPVAVRRSKLSFGAVPAVQLLLSAVCAGVMWYLLHGGEEMQTAAEEIIGRIIGG